MAKKVDNSKLDFEKRIWDAACVLRGNLDASEYKHVVLGLIFLPEDLSLSNIAKRHSSKSRILFSKISTFSLSIDIK